MNSHAKLVSLALIAIFSLFSLPASAREPVKQSASSNQFELKVAKTSISVKTNGKLSISQEELKRYVTDAANAVVAYYGRFPLSKLVITVQAASSGGIGLGTANYERDGAYGTIELNLGPETNVASLNDSWTLTHEMMHLGFPLMEDNTSWLAEGIATYIEPIGRMRIGKMTREKIWGEMLEGCPRGLPKGNDLGLNFAHSINRIYWGGALYCLIADIEIRQKTNNKFGLEHALRAIANKGGDISSDWSAEKAIEVGDKALGLHVLQDLYNRMALHPEQINLPKLWQELGVQTFFKQTSFKDDAPLASIRKAIENN